ncbi:MAG TPA: hypothetical protein VE996_03995 [Terriglobales bacterium]|nr:hypothetical protein [Terriglobales bacterium]
MEKASATKTSTAFPKARRAGAERRRWGWAALAASMVCVPAAARAGGRGAAGSAPAGVMARVVVSRGQLGRAIPRDFVGLSLEVSTGGQGIGAFHGGSAAGAAAGGGEREWSEQYALGHPGAPNAGFFRFMRNLGPGVLRLGGNSQDNTCWAQAPHPAECQATLTAADLRLFAAAARASGWRLILGLNLKQDDPAWAEREVADGVAKTIPAAAIWALEIGNEPDLFARGARPRGYSPQDHVGEFLAYLRALRANPATRAYAVAGPATCCRWRNPRDLGVFLDGVGANHLALATVHNYAGTVCGGRALTVAQLLDPARRARFAAAAQALAAAARARGVPLAMAETNSASCGGMPGVSDAFAATVWAMDYMFTLARDGYRTVNFHISYRPGGGSSYDAVRTFGERGGGGWRYRNQAEPLYYAMYLFARHASGARLAPARVEASTNVSAFAVSQCAGCGVRVFVINADAQASGRIVVAGAGGAAARLLFLRAPSLSATAGAVSLGGAKFDDQGRLGRVRATEIRPDAGGDYTFDLPTAAIALLETEPGTTRR